MTLNWREVHGIQEVCEIEGGKKRVENMSDTIVTPAIEAGQGPDRSYRMCMVAVLISCFGILVFSPALFQRYCFADSNGISWMP